LEFGVLKVTLGNGVVFYISENLNVSAVAESLAYLKTRRVLPEYESLTEAAMHDITPPAVSSQVGGDHYKNMKLQPWQVMRAVMTREEYTAYHIGTVIAYLMRHKAKGGEQDIKKAQHHLTELVEYLNEKATG
jgi:hypothetical protein